MLFWFLLFHPFVGGAAVFSLPPNVQLSEKSVVAMLLTASSHTINFVPVFTTVFPTLTTFHSCAVKDGFTIDV